MTSELIVGLKFSAVCLMFLQQKIDKFFVDLLDLWLDYTVLDHQHKIFGGRKLFCQTNFRELVFKQKSQKFLGIQYV